ncbi:sugar ABC transporter permease [Trueperella pyogenes]|uniref:carbohydrate ABC transporter permease n=1 Tax=Trueperella pyogenes TaxID=1661 RepID=UPI00345CECC7
MKTIRLRTPLRAHTAETAASALFLLPILAVFVALVLVPLIQSIAYSFTDYTGLGREIHFVGLSNYVTVFTNPDLRMALGFTVLFATTTTVLITLLAIPLAVVLNNKFFGRDAVRSLFFFLGVPSHAILGLVWLYIFSPLDSGALNSLLKTLHLSPSLWLADSMLARVCVIVVAVWAGIGWHATLYLAYLQAIPTDIYEQSQVDGANSLQQFFHITLPHLVPAILVSTFLLMTSGLKVFELPYAMTKGGPGYSTFTVTQSIVEQGIAQGRYGLGSALAVIFTLASLLIVLAQMYVAKVVSERFA